MTTTKLFITALIPIRHNSTGSVPTSNLVCIKMAFILNFQSHDKNVAVPLSTAVKSSFCLCSILVRLKDDIERTKLKA